jgi:hypothetical protein
MLASLSVLCGGASAQVVTKFSAGITAGGDPFGITAGPDGNLWFTEQGGTIQFALLADLSLGAMLRTRCYVRRRASTCLAGCQAQA